MEHARPPDPPPMTIRSYVYSSVGGTIKFISFPSWWSFIVASAPPTWFPRMKMLGTDLCPVFSFNLSWMDWQLSAKKWDFEFDRILLTWKAECINPHTSSYEKKRKKFWLLIILKHWRNSHTKLLKKRERVWASVT